jgi:LmbE family N-acetylglucosaminyl deacetylase
LLTYPRFLGAIKPDLLGKRNEAEFQAELACLKSAWWPAQLTCPIGNRILALSAHPDDETIGAGGLLIAHREKARISVITIFTGDGGGFLQADDPNAPGYRARLAAARIEELRRACSYFAGEFIDCLGLPDGSETADVLKLSDRLREMVEDIRPDVVILPWLLDQHKDHRNANLLWATACADVRCMVLGTELWSLTSPNALFDIGQTLAGKLAAVGEFKTQLATVDYICLVENLAKIRAYYWGVHERRVGAAEGFFALPNREYCALVLKLKEMQIR